MSAHFQQVYDYRVKVAVLGKNIMIGDRIEIQDWVSALKLLPEVSGISYVLNSKGIATMVVVTLTDGFSINDSTLEVAMTSIIEVWRKINDSTNTDS